MADLAVNYAALAAAAADIQASATKIENRLAELDKQLQPLRASWTGEAATAYEAAKAKWTAALSDMKALLAAIGRQVTTTSESYQATDRNVAKAF